MRRLSLLLFLALATLALVGCKGDEKSEEKADDTVKVDFPGTMDGAKQVVGLYLASDAKPDAITAALKPTAADYEAIFSKDVDAIKAAYEEQWASGEMVVTHDADQTEVLIWASPSEGFADMLEGDSKFFPGGYQKAGEWFKPGLTFYRFKFVPPGEELGMGWDGLIYVNDHWVFLPKPWRALPGWVPPTDEMDMIFDNMSPYDIAKMLAEP